MSKKKRPRVAYISGAITGVPDYRERFAWAERILRRDGYIVLNPAILPEGMPYRRYMPICLAMVAAADAVYVLPGSEGSKGTIAEVAYAITQGKEVVWL